MYTFEYLFKNRTVRADLATKVESLGTFKGKQDLYLRTKPEALDVLRETAVSQSTAASNAIEGIEVAPDRLDALLARRDAPRNRPEEEIAGYRDVLRGMDDLSDPERTAITPTSILRMHKDLYKYADNPDAGRWKSKDNVIEARATKGVIGIVFRPPAAAVTPRFIEELCRHLARAREKKEAPAPIIIAAFILDFLCIHPFDDGNGRVARLLTHLLLLQEGYLVGKYVPLERLIFETKDAYYGALRESTTGWHAARHDPDHWTRYLLDILIRAYRELEGRVAAVDKAAAPLAALIRDATLSRKKFKIRELLAAFPNVSRPYVYRVVKELISEGRLKRAARGVYVVAARER